MFFWKFTRSGKYSSEYISLIVDFHDSSLKDNHLISNFEECKDILLLIQDVEKLNGRVNLSAGLEKLPFQEQVSKLGYKADNSYEEQRKVRNLVLGQMTLGTHGGCPLDYGISDKKGVPVSLNLANLKISMMINAATGIAYGTEDKLKAYRNHPQFVDKGEYFDLMPAHSCIVEIVGAMMRADKNRTVDFLENDLKWKKIRHI